MREADTSHCPSLTAHGRRCGSPERSGPTKVSITSLEVAIPYLDKLGYPGEIDILEGVNDKGTNRASLHTTSGGSGFSAATFPQLDDQYDSTIGCTMPASRTMGGTSVGDNCDVAATGNGGCGVSSNDTKSYGPAFNKAGGGFYAMERGDAGVKIWFWRRSSCKIPSEVLSGATQIDTDKWGTPFAIFPSNSCDMDSHFGQHSIIINLTLCKSSKPPCAHEFFDRPYLDGRW